MALLGPVLSHQTSSGANGRCGLADRHPGCSLQPSGRGATPRRFGFAPRRTGQPNRVAFRGFAASPKPRRLHAGISHSPRQA